MVLLSSRAFHIHSRRVRPTGRNCTLTGPLSCTSAIVSSCARPAWRLARRSARGVPPRIHPGRGLAAGRGYPAAYFGHAALVLGLRGGPAEEDGGEGQQRDEPRGHPHEDPAE